jgi:hypothetical protein
MSGIGSGVSALAEGALVRVGMRVWTGSVMDESHFSVRAAERRERHDLNLTPS